VGTHESIDVAAKTQHVASQSAGLFVVPVLACRAVASAKAEAHGAAERRKP
jgi:hypothetical protein